MGDVIAQGAEGIIVVPTDSDAIVPALSYAAEQDVPVVAIDIGPAGGEVAMIVRADNIRMGADACQQMGEALGGQEPGRPARSARCVGLAAHGDGLVLSFGSRTARGEGIGEFIRSV